MDAKTIKIGLTITSFVLTQIIDRVDAKQRKLEDKKYLDTLFAEYIKSKEN